MSRTVLGIDLAWSDRNTSGVVVARDGVVVASATCSDDAEVAALVPDGPVVVAFDAPIVVHNDGGRRRCDAEISRVFARYDAGAYPANRSIPWLREPRAGRLTRLLGLDVDPSADRVALEVYPHPATITLFGLDRVLPYKRRRGRHLAGRRHALSGLCDHLEACDGLDVRTGLRWPALRSAVAGATTQAALGRVEDEIDAHVCALVGAIFESDPAAVDVVGDPHHGAIVVPCSPRTSPLLDGAPQR